jgi:AcrR family transcriptional regulator
MTVTPKTAPARLRRSASAMADLKLEMLARARVIYREEGIAALSIRRLADEFQLSPMALYSYFPSKQALLRGLWVEVFEALVERLLEAAAGRRAPARVLEAHLRAFIAFWEERPDQYRMVYMSLQQSVDGVEMERQPVYARLVGLTQERVAACAGGAAEPNEESLRMLGDLVVAKLLGYLQLTLGLARYPLLDREGLREHIVQDMLRSAAQGLD